MYIITGGAGFIGSALVWELNKHGIFDIIVVDNLASTNKWLNLSHLRIRDYIHKDIFIENVRKNGLAQEVKAVIHLGACSSTMEQNADYLMENNFHYTRDLFLAAKEKNIRFLNASSAATFGGGEHGFSNDLSFIKKYRPLNAYAFSKQLFDLWTLDTNNLNNLVSLKFFNVYGPNEYHKGNMQSVVCKAVPQIQNENVMRLFKSAHPDYKDGEQMRDFVYIKDVVKLMYWLLENPNVTGIYNVGQGLARSWNDLVKAVYSAMGLETKIEYINMPKELLGKYQYYTHADMTWLKDVIYPYAFSTLEDGITDYVQNYLLKEDKYLDYSVE